MKYYIADPLDTRWNDVEFSFIGAINGKTYVSSQANITFTKAVKLPDELKKEPNPDEILVKLKAEFIKAVDNILDSEAKKKGYDNIVTARSYAGYDNAFRAEGEAFGRWSAEVWKWAYTLQDKVEKGQMDISKLRVENVLKDMPKLELQSKE
ncbi:MULTISPECIES: hypothetical protein [unclassified Campylobacter]|uniref:hypothetical protein n=1 Tax=unclassified Campylobacter TaxID=2593542 RepID=UPI003D32A716